MAHHETELAIKYLMIAGLSTTCKVGVWHTMKELAGKSLTVADFFAHIGSIQYDMQGQNLLVYLTVAALNRAGNVRVWHAMTQNWQVRLLVTANQ